MGRYRIERNDESRIEVDVEDGGDDVKGWERDVAHDGQRTTRRALQVAGRMRKGFLRYKHATTAQSIVPPKSGFP